MRLTPIVDVITTFQRTASYSRPKVSDLRSDERASREIDRDHVVGRFRRIAVRGRVIFDAQLLLGDDDPSGFSTTIVAVALLPELRDDRVSSPLRPLGRRRGAAGAAERGGSLMGSEDQAGAGTVSRPPGRQWMALARAEDAEQLRFRRLFAGRRNSSKSEKPTLTPNQVFFSSLGAAFGGDRTPSATAKEAFGRGGRKDCAGSGAEKQPIGRQ